MNAGRPPSPRIEAADRVQTAFDFSRRGRGAQLEGRGVEVPLSLLGDPQAGGARLTSGPGDNPERRGDRADQTTRNGLKWLTSADHQYLVKEANRTYGKWSSVAGVLLDMERTLSDVRLVLEKISKEEPAWDPGIPGVGPRCKATSLRKDDARLRGCPGEEGPRPTQCGRLVRRPCQSNRHRQGDSSSPTFGSAGSNRARKPALQLGTPVSAGKFWVLPISRNSSSSGSRRHSDQHQNASKGSGPKSWSGERPIPMRSESLWTWSERTDLKTVSQSASRSIGSGKLTRISESKRRIWRRTRARSRRRSRELTAIGARRSP